MLKKGEPASLKTILAMPLAIARNAEQYVEIFTVSPAVFMVLFTVVARTSDLSKNCFSSWGHPILLRNISSMILQ